MNILLVDDDPIITDTLEMLLEDDYTVLIANHPYEAVKTIRENKKINLLITDHIMPEMNGVELLKETKLINPDIQRLMLTGYGDAKELKGIISNGIVQKIIVKPWDPDILKTIIKQVLDKRPK